ncbi:excalibur calcium-binding domain-containing protein [Spirilliplanes yamanashiensis]|uniref:Excalibur calcium-binding domain-containing protein n=1 Tax=Spirilliplanes yamanashiensis TaxID=42233 RepID=A0A8J3YED1_9ACTN|nr:excalibur calcium-binding domain-containing protein [Spirilliplanes yamanashiensis]MDP9816710.1 type IV secretory pathway VirB10-like protein [Spirilliplanes yamanashiensis]GIJ06232.1 hypothetical protein Sya03_55840 [Spirilliplanes yamanashiensis]
MRVPQNLTKVDKGLIGGGLAALVAMCCGGAIAAGRDEAGKPTAPVDVVATAPPPSINQADPALEASVAASRSVEASISASRSAEADRLNKQWEKEAEEAEREAEEAAEREEAERRKAEEEADQEEEDEAESVYYANCAAAERAGAAPLYRGDPGYRSGLDRDNDGDACE